MNKALPLLVALLLTAGLTPARALHREEVPIVTRLAQELERRAGHVVQAAAVQAHHFSRREARMLGSLRHFHGQAARLRAGLERYFTHPAQVDQAIAELNEDADRVERYIYRSHAVSHVVADWNRCAALLRQLNRYFDVGGSHHDVDHH